MDLLINQADPLVMHVDLNSCFAMVEQQARPHLRGRPVCVAANVSPGGCVISPSYEAKRLGIKVGFRVRDALSLCPQAIILPPDPDKYFFVHQKFRDIFQRFSPKVTPKSIDEAVIDFNQSGQIGCPNLTELGYEIKRLMKEEIGEWITCNVGIGTNRFLAKLAASLHKPDGMDVITNQNLLDVLGSVKLTDLCGINIRYEARLNRAGIFTPVDFFSASLDKLRKEVFRSIVGYYWYARLRGWEVDTVEASRRSYGQSYALYRFTANTDQLAVLLMKLCEKMGRRLRRSKNRARGIQVGCRFIDWSYWHHGELIHDQLYATPDLYRHAMRILSNRPANRKVTHLDVSCFELQPLEPYQQQLFDMGKEKIERLADSLDQINDRYGEYVVRPAIMLGTDNVVIKRVAFGAVKELQDLYES